MLLHIQKLMDPQSHYNFLTLLVILLQYQNDSGFMVFQNHLEPSQLPCRHWGDGKLQLVGMGKLIG